MDDIFFVYLRRIVDIRLRMAVGIIKVKDKSAALVVTLNLSIAFIAVKLMNAGVPLLAS